MKTKIIPTESEISNLDSWTEIVEFCPIDLRRVEIHSSDFQSYISVPITLQTIEFAKRRLFEARNSLDLMITTLVQLLYDREIMTQAEDRVLFAWLKDDLGRLMQDLDESQNSNMVVFDSPNQKVSRIGISRIGTYSKELNTTYQSMYEALIKSIKEYYSFKENEKANILREPRTFLYILFHVFQITLSILGGITRKPATRNGRKGTVSEYPQTWQNMMTTQGKEEIRTQYKQETGIELPPISADLLEDSPNENSFSGEFENE